MDLPLNVSTTASSGEKQWLLSNKGLKESWLSFFQHTERIQLVMTHKEIVLSSLCTSASKNKVHFKLCIFWLMCWLPPSRGGAVHGLMLS